MIGVVFYRTRAAGYRDAIALAARATKYEEDAGRHVATYEGVAAAGLVPLWDLVGRWRGSRVLVDDVPVTLRDLHELLGVLACLGRAVAMEGSTYCRAGLSLDPATWTATPVIPCRYFMERAGYGLHAMDWTNPVTRIDTVRALAIRHGVHRCPLLDLAGLGERLERWVPVSEA